MPSEERIIIARVVENYIQSGNAHDEHISVIILPHGKTSYVEYIGEDGRSIMLDEYHSNGKIVWAGYSSRSKTVYLSSPNN